MASMTQLLEPGQSHDTLTEKLLESGQFHDMLTEEVLEEVIRDASVYTLACLMRVDKTLRDRVIACLRRIDKPDHSGCFLLHKALHEKVTSPILNRFIMELLQANPATAHASDLELLTPLHIAVTNRHAPCTVRAIFHANEHAARFTQSECISGLEKYKRLSVSQLASNAGYSAGIVDMLTIRDVPTARTVNWGEVQSKMASGAYVELRDTPDASRRYLLHHALCTPEDVVSDALIFALLDANPNVTFWCDCHGYNALCMSLLNRRSRAVVLSVFGANPHAAVVFGGMPGLYATPENAVSFAVKFDYDIDIIKLMVVSKHEHSQEAIQTAIQERKSLSRLEELRTMYKESIEYVANGEACVCAIFRDNSTERSMTSSAWDDLIKYLASHTREEYRRKLVSTALMERNSENMISWFLTRNPECFIIPFNASRLRGEQLWYPFVCMLTRGYCDDLLIRVLEISPEAAYSAIKGIYTGMDVNARNKYSNTHVLRLVAERQHHTNPRLDELVATYNGMTM